MPSAISHQPSAMTATGHFAVITKCPRRFCCQHDSPSSLHTGCSLPLLTTVSRPAATPRFVRYSFTAFARRDPRARLYSALPRESQCPSTLTCVLVHFFIQSASFWSRPFASSRISDLSRSKRTSSSGRSSLSCATDLRAKISSSVRGRGAGAGAGGGGAGGGGGVTGAVGVGGGGGAGAAGGTFLWQPATTKARTRLSPSTDARRRTRVIALLTCVVSLLQLTKLRHTSGVQ